MIMMSRLSSCSALLVAILICSSLTQGLARRRELSKFSYADLRKCSYTEKSCRTCWSECPAARKSFFASDVATFAHEDAVSSLQECVRETRHYRQWLPKWCINDENGFYATEEFPLFRSNCLLQPIACADNLRSTAYSDLEKKKLSRTSKKFILALKIGKLGRAQKTLAHETSEFAKEKKKVAQENEAWKNRWLEEATFHLQDPKENTTKYADPIFQNYREILKENRALDFEVSRNDIVSASVENKFVRRDTVDKIPGLVSSIDGLKNQIHSKKSLTDRYLTEIKTIAQKALKAQTDATNIIYETTHSKELDGEIVLLDKDLLELYTELKKERATLRDTNLKSTFSKLRLVGIMRMTIQQITQKQLKNGCAASEIMGL